MKSSRFRNHFVLVLLVWLAFAAYVWWTMPQLPPHIAIHFGTNGVPNNWATPAEYVRFTLIMGAAVPAFILGIFALVRFGDGSLMNIPHKDYWLAPERRKETMDFVLARGCVFTALFIGFFAGVHYFILVANAQAPVMLPGKYVGWVGGCFLAAAIAWTAAFVTHFSRKPV
jgi:hypothetical protein